MSVDPFRKSLDLAAKALLSKVVTALQNLDVNGAELGDIERALRTLVYYERNRPKLLEAGDESPAEELPFRLRVAKIEKPESEAA